MTGRYWRRIWFPLLLVVAVAGSCLLYRASYRYDNKYTAARVPAQNGVMQIGPGVLDETPVLFLIEGWEFYQYKLLTPGELARGAAVPDAYLFIGQYGGFELGDPEASPHGDATYRLTVFLDEAPRDYALELPEIFSAYRIWINGELRHSEGLGGAGEYAPRTSNGMLTFRAQGRVEIVVAVTDHSHFYSGITYPPAFGRPEAVYRQVLLRNLIHGVACGSALVAAGFCFLYAALRRFRGNIQFLGLLCLCYVGYGSYPLVHMLGLPGELWYSLELLSHYSMFWVILWLQGRVCRVPRRVYLPAVWVGIAVSVSMALVRYLPVETAADLYRISRWVGRYMWLAAAYLLAVSLWALVRGRAHSKPLFTGICIFGAALVYDRAYPWFEPVLFGWHTETAGLLLIGIVAGILARDTARVYRESRALREREALDTQRIGLLREQARLQQELVEQAHTGMHEYRSRLMVMLTKLRGGEYSALQQYISEQLEQSAHLPENRWCDHELCNLICGSAVSAAERQGVRLELEARVPEKLPMEERDLASLLTNIVDNALEACARVPAERRWITLELRYSGGAFAVHCRNSHGGVSTDGAGGYRTTKEEGQRHGYGLKVLEAVARKYGGLLEVDHDEEAFRVYLGINLGEE